MYAFLNVCTLKSPVGSACARTCAPAGAEHYPVDGPGVVRQDGRQPEAPEPVAALVEVDSAVPQPDGHQGLARRDARQLRRLQALCEAVHPPEIRTYLCIFRFFTNTVELG